MITAQSNSVDIEVSRNTMLGNESRPIEIDLWSEGEGVLALICASETYTSHVTAGNIDFSDRYDGGMSVLAASADKGYTFLRELGEELSNITLRPSPDISKMGMKDIIQKIGKGL